MTDAALTLMPARELFRHRGVRPLVGMQFLVSIALQAQITALLAFVYDISGSKLDLGLIGLAEFAPSFLLVLITGSVADRYDRRRIVLAAIALEVCCSGALLAYARTGPTAVGPIFAIVFVFGIARAFHGPASRSMPPNIAPPGGLSRLVAFWSLSWQAASIVGPVLGGLLYAARPTAPYVAVFSLLSAALVVGWRLPPQPAAEGARDEPPTIRAALEGLVLIRRTPILLGAISLDLFAVLFGGAVALIPAIAQRMHIGPGGQGLLRAAGGIGASITAIALARYPLHRHVGRWLFVAVGIFGVATIGLGLTRTFAVGLICMAVLTSADMVSVFVRSTVVPLATPDGTRGRVNAVEQVFIGASNELGAFESGVAASVIGTSGAVVSGGIATLAVVGIWCWKFPALRKVDRFSELEHGKA